MSELQRQVASLQHVTDQLRHHEDQGTYDAIMSKSLSQLIPMQQDVSLDDANMPIGGNSSSKVCTIM